jgi:hypothetical protein
VRGPGDGASLSRASACLSTVLIGSWAANGWAAWRGRGHRAGPGESGKSTIFKQMKLINLGSIPLEERKSYVVLVRTSVLSQMRALCKELQSLNASLITVRAVVGRCGSVAPRGQAEKRRRTTSLSAREHRWA